MRKAGPKQRQRHTCSLSDGLEKCGLHSINPRTRGCQEKIVSSYRGVEFCGETGPGFKKHLDLDKSTLTLREQMKE